MFRSHGNRSVPVRASRSPGETMAVRLRMKTPGSPVVNTRS